RRLQGVARELGVVPIEVGTEAEPPAATAATAREESGAVAGEAYRQRFRAALADDLNAPKAMAVVWEVARSESLPKPVRRTLLRAFDTVLGLRLGEARPGQDEEWGRDPRIDALVAE